MNGCGHNKKKGLKKQLKSFYCIILSLMLKKELLGGHP